MRTALVFGIATLALCSALPSRAAVSDPNFEETAFANSGTNASLTSIAWAPDGSHRLFVTKKEGEIRIIENGSVLPTPFAVISPIYTQSESGLLSIAFDPDFGSNGFVYVFATVAGSEQRILRFRAEGNRGVDETVILSGLPARGSNHNGGTIAFGPDAKLYWAIGDLGFDVGSGSDLASLGAKVGRANRDGSDPEDNPFADGGGPNHELVWARGLRNPFTMTFQPETERLWVNVVGSSWEQVFVVGAGDHIGYPNYENTQPSGFITPSIAYRTNDVDTFDVTSAVRSGGVTRVTTAQAHYLREGAPLTFAGSSNASFDGLWHVSSVISPTVFEVAQPGPNASASGGTAATQAVGGCIIGGTFYDSSAGTSAYRGNFFFGDFNTGNIVRARVDGARVLGWDLWGQQTRVVDLAVGPDGDLYYATHTGNGQVLRARFRATEPGIVVSRAHLRLLEQGVGAFHVRLATAPAAPVAVNVRRSSGDADVAITAGQRLSFGPSDWSVPQVVRLAAARDADASDDLAELEVSADGIGSEAVVVRVTDEWSGTLPPGDGGASPGGAGGEGPDGGDSGEDTGGAAGTSGGGGSGRGGASAGASGGDAGSGEGGAGESGGGGAGAGGTPAGGGRSSTPESPSAGDDSGCGCRLSRGPGDGAAALLFLGLLARRRRRR